MTLKKFFKDVDKRSKKAMIAFLESHFRYNTSNSWNNSTSYANNVKIYNLEFDSATAEAAWGMLNIEEVYDNIGIILDDWAAEQDYRWQVGFNGRSGGYLVLYQGGKKPSGHKSYCTNCGQRNFTTTEETGRKCGKCGAEARQNFIKPPMQIFTYPGKSVDMHEDFEDWDMYALRNRVELVQSFDRLCDDVVAAFKSFCTEFEIVDEEITVKKTIKVLQEKVS